MSVESKPPAHVDCAWCDDPILDEDERVEIRRYDHYHDGANSKEDGEYVAAFHAGVCFTEAADYGWR